VAGGRLEVRDAFALGVPGAWRRQSHEVDLGAREADVRELPGVQRLQFAQRGARPARLGVLRHDGKGEAAIYGPKIDFIAKDSIGRTQQIATIQLDFNQPKNFGLVCTNEKGEKEMIVMIHCAIMGSIERFLSVLIEHLGGNFPLWLAPTQVALLPISDDQMPFTNDLATKLREADIRVDVYGESESLGKKIRATREERIPYRIVVGKNEIAEGKVSLESRSGEKSGPYSADELLAKLTEEITTKKSS